MASSIVDVVDAVCVNTERSDMFSRAVPRVRWRVVGILMLSITLCAVGVWEWQMRSLGLRAEDLDDGNAYWAVERRKVDSGPRDQVVIVGDSRSGFDINLDVWQQVSGVRPIQLGYAFSSWQRVLEDLASDEHFSGMVVVAMADAGFFENRFTNYSMVLDYLHKESPSQRIGHQLMLPLQRTFAFLDGYYTPFALLQQLWLPDRIGRGPPVPKLSESLADRQAVMWKRVETDTTYRDYMRAVWTRAYRPGRVPDTSIRAAIDAIKKPIETIRRRGGEVVLIRPPSDGLVLAHERTAAPRDKAWDVLVRDTATFGIHFEDYPAMQGLNVVEWSHLSGDSAKQFTRAYVTVLCQQLPWLKEHGATCKEN